MSYEKLHVQDPVPPLPQKYTWFLLVFFVSLTVMTALFAPLHWSTTSGRILLSRKGRVRVEEGVIWHLRDRRESEYKNSTMKEGGPSSPNFPDANAAKKKPPT